MSRQIAISKLNFASREIMMESVIDSWGEDDPIVKMCIDGTFDENQSLAIWSYLVQTANVGELFLDVGSYSGLFSLLGAKLNSMPQFVMFEASRVTYGRAIRNLVLNSIEQHICAANFAVWSEETIVDLPHRYGIYSMCPGESAEFDPSQADHVERSLAIPLDILLRIDRDLPGSLGSKALGVKAFSRIVAIKIDVEGVEEKVLSGAIQILRNQRPIIICEILDDITKDKITETLTNFSYLVRKIADERNFLLLPLERVEQFDREFTKWCNEQFHGKYMSAERFITMTV
ncbi:FkbM family methyltransferase [Methylobacterium aquaticum]|uniref:FkbM family methyltransferase n=1 Tax=Methylobacterium aquaticum TaxID=270351 RepID=UPI000AD5D608|nr:FkbM family methyltransferase [Methylobacterium aquaticum]